jgi:foldase protein PrsA
MTWCAPMKARFLFPILVALVLVAGCGGGGKTASLQSADVAVVGSKHVAQQRFDALLLQARVNLKASGRPFPKAGTTDYESIKTQAMNLLISDAERELEAGELGIEITDKAINDRLATIKKQYFGGNEKRYKEQIKAQGLTDAEVRNQIRAVLISEQLFEKVTKETKVTDAEVHKYYTENSDQYVEPDTRDVRHILVGSKALADRLYAELKAGGNFAALAKEHSEDPGSKDIGGKFTARKGQDVPEFDEVSFRIKTNEIAPPVRTQFGWHIIQATGPIRKAKKTPEKQVAATIRQQLLQEKRNTEMTDWLTEVSKDYCTSGRIKYQVGFQPNPDPCAQYTATTTTTTS